MSHQLSRQLVYEPVQQGRVQHCLSSFRWLIVELKLRFGARIAHGNDGFSRRSPFPADKIAHHYH